jgi:hypothetical protein
MVGLSQEALLPATLRIDFARGERPDRFWVSQWSPQSGPGIRVRYKVLSKRRADRSREVLVLEERSPGGTRALRVAEIPATSPAGWLEHWARRLASDLGIRFTEFDLSAIETLEEWRDETRRLGWRIEG